jgi:hypothetical protein
MRSCIGKVDESHSRNSTKILCLDESALQSWEFKLYEVGEFKSFSPHSSRTEMREKLEATYQYDKKFNHKSS